MSRLSEVSVHKNERSTKIGTNNITQEEVLMAILGTLEDISETLAIIADKKQD